jgi:hypothetical protein
MKWKLWTRDETAILAVVSSEQLDSKQDALEAACGLIGPPIRQLRVKVLYIEEPDGKRISFEEIEAWCKRIEPPGTKRGGL